MFTRIRPLEVDLFLSLKTPKFNFTDEERATLKQQSSDLFKDCLQKIQETFDVELVSRAVQTSWKDRKGLINLTGYYFDINRKVVDVDFEEDVLKKLERELKDYVVEFASNVKETLQLKDVKELEYCCASVIVKAQTEEVYFDLQVI